ncbi:MAG TPA: UDP-N-acetylmuramate dehydrogenase, partial [Methylococcaceae bacterium]|nr:UDP-N-acetylmuramate dehydrogenase [Methylococcaceae bacterium]
GLPEGEPLLWLGLGSNLLVRDGGVRGTVIYTRGLNALRRNSEDLCEIYAEAGVPCAHVARFSAEHGLSGAEFFAGIPGTLGGALAMNAGAFGGETWAIASGVETVDRRGLVRRRGRSEFEIGYRHVRGAPGEWFLAAHLRLAAADGADSRAAIRELLARRNASQPVSQPSCGSVFRNPPGDFAARLIESCGLKGYKIGGAEVSEKHANFIVNTGGATAADIETLIGHVQAEVAKRHGVHLETEVRVVGERNDHGDSGLCGT